MVFLKQIGDIPLIELGQYIVLFLVVFAMSPLGVFLLRYLIAILFRLPRPILRKKSVTVEKQIVDFTIAARSHIDELVSKISELREENAMQTRIISRLEAENEALREHIRSLEAGGSSCGTEDPDLASSHNVRSTDYETLGLDPNGVHSMADIRRAFRSLVRDHHPDRGGDAERLKVIIAAYDRLKRHCEK